MILFRSPLVLEDKNVASLVIILMAYNFSKVGQYSNFKVSLLLFHEKTIMAVHPFLLHCLWLYYKHLCMRVVYRILKKGSACGKRLQKIRTPRETALPSPFLYTPTPL